MTDIPRKAIQATAHLLRHRHGVEKTPDQVADELTDAFREIRDGMAAAGLPVPDSDLRLMELITLALGDPL